MGTTWKSHRRVNSLMFRRWCFMTLGENHKSWDEMKTDRCLLFGPMSSLTPISLDTLECCLTVIAASLGNRQKS